MPAIINATSETSVIIKTKLINSLKQNIFSSFVALATHKKLDSFVNEKTDTYSWISPVLLKPCTHQYFSYLGASGNVGDDRHR